MNTKLKVGLSSCLLLGIAALLLLQQREIKRRAAESADLRRQLSLMVSLQETNGHLAEQLKAAVEASEANQGELARLRGQAVRLRQVETENAQLKSQTQLVDHQIQQAQLAAGSSQPMVVAEAIKAGNEIPNPRTTDLGILELSDGTAIRFDLGGGTNCVVTPTALSDGNNMMQISVGVTNADGTISELGTSRLTARPGQHCSISVGDRMIALAVTLK
jgi:uncharacterized protein YydD (DUF2326 family)